MSFFCAFAILLLLDPSTGIPVPLPITVQSDSCWGGKVQGKWIEVYAGSIADH